MTEMGDELGASGSHQPEVSWDTSVAGDQAPRQDYSLEIANIVSGGLGGRFNTATWKFEIPAGLGAGDMNRVMTNLGAGKFFTNVNHRIKCLPILFGSHWEIKFRDNWYHFVFSGGTIRNLQLLEWHYEKFQPSSRKHWTDWRKTRGRAPG